MAGGQMVAGG
jgi:Sec7-like guanine-nucleotide exchange factor